ncbi:FtsX-like permease family protein [Sanguibacter antarcticus]|uniref:Putative ABC transport system permease protein n=1 Tax=Sanguibacter antarcticus TaxID=372484 RepID=A0A2A9E0M0_9MICO|nr:FtsX-like permease family protein [Sanguibacter antarcticus]PFG32488.1 putative ABC transport system permease protein [Sanguibacter antarcticus]
MLALTFAQMRQSVGRLAAAGIAIVIGTAFVAATLLAGDVLKRAGFDSVAAGYGDADLVLVDDGEPRSGLGGLSSDDIDALRSLDGIAALDGVGRTFTTFAHRDRRASLPVIPTGSDPALQPLVATSGRMPAALGEVALPEATAERLHVGVGDEVGRARATFIAGPPGAGLDLESMITMVVVGLLDDPDGAFAMEGGAAVMTEESLLDGLPDEALPFFTGAVVALDAGADLPEVGATLAAAAPTGYDVLTKDEAAARTVSSLTAGADIFTGTILAFAAIALLVAALVIANTFQVLVAQRTRTLALLRCVGATKAQVHRSVVLEAATLGVVASVVGVALGSVLVQVAVMMLRGAELAVPVPPTITITAASVLVPLVVGTVVTILASLVPARAATRVAPLAALRPAESPSTDGAAGQARLVVCLVALVGGLTACVGAVLLTDHAAEVALFASVLGGCLSFVAILLCAVYWVPAVVRVVGRPLSRRGASAQLAAANTARNPRRTTATSTALLIGVTLVAMMSVAAATTRSSLDGTLDDTFPVDLSVASDAPGGRTPTPLSTELLDQLAAVDGVAHVTPLVSTEVTISWDGQTVLGTGTLRGVDPDDARAAVRSPGWFDGLTDDVVLLSQDLADAYDMPADAVLELTGPSGTVVLSTTITELPLLELIVTPAALAQVDAAAGITQAWVRLSDIDEAATTIDTVRETLSEDAVTISGAALERATIQQLIDAILAVTVGLLGIAVLIAFVGVANTLSLSVLERRRESATLRAIGLSRRQLRSTLAIEGMLIAGVGAVAGVVLGLGYGWMGAAVVLGSFADIHLSVPWLQLTSIVAVALAAGLLASVLPARSAARTSPVEALAVE